MEKEELKITVDPDIWISAQQALERAIWFYLKDPRVSLIDLGLRIRKSERIKIEPELVVRIHLHQNLSAETFSDFIEHSLFKEINIQRIGFAVDVVAASYVLNHQSNDSDDFDPDQYQYNGMRLVNHVVGSVGTAGGMVQDCETGEDLLLSSWHVLASSWNIEQNFEISSSPDNFNRSHSIVAINTTRHSISTHLDAAVARICDPYNFQGRQLSIPVTGVATPRLGMQVIKSGAGTGITSGIITGILGYSIQSYNGMKWIIGPSIHISSEAIDLKLCSSGDSGAWWLDQFTRQAIGLHFAGSTDSNYGLALPMLDVLNALDVRIIANQSGKHMSVQCTGISKNTTKEPVPVQLTDIAETGQTVVIHETKNSIDLLTSNKLILLKFLDFKRLSKRLKLYNIFKKVLIISYNNIIKIDYKFAQLSLIVLLSIMILRFSLHQLQKFQQYQTKIDQLEGAVLNTIAIVKMDHKLDYTIKKIITIIDLYNFEMEPDLKLKIAREIYEMSLKYSNLDSELICATITHETALTWNPNIVSPANAIGMMQILSTTGCSLAQEEGLKFDNIQELLYDPIMNIRLGCRYLSKLISAYNIDGGLAAYNGGMRRAEMWVRNGRAKGILHEETDKYVPSILKIYQEFRRM